MEERDQRELKKSKVGRRFGELFCHPLHTRGNAVVELLVFFVVIAVTSGLVLFLVQSGVITVKAQTQEVLNVQFLPYQQESYLALHSFSFCGLVEQFRCTDVREEFHLGEKVYVLFTVESSARNGEIFLQRNYRLTDPAGVVVLELDEEKSYPVQVNAQGKEVVTFADYFTTDAAALPGEYTLDVLVENPLLEKKITVQKRLRLG